MSHCTRCGLPLKKEAGLEDQLPLEECSCEKTKKARQLAFTKFRTACEAGDITQTEEIFQSGQLDRTDIQSLLDWSIEKALVEPTRWLLEHGADAKTMYWRNLEKCHSLDIFKLLANFGLDYNTKKHNILQ
jgi:hypothetical protein